MSTTPTSTTTTKRAAAEEEQKEIIPEANPGDLLKAVTDMYLSWGSIKDASRVQYYITKGEILLVTKVNPNVRYKHLEWEDEENYVVYEMIHNNNIVSSWIYHEEIKDIRTIFSDLFEKIIV